MSEIVVHPTPEILKRFHPLDQLNDIQLELLGRSIQIHSAGRGLKMEMSRHSASTSSKASYGFSPLTAGSLRSSMTPLRHRAPSPI
ncbi:MAG: hypothetical protein N0E38_21775 [Candidatus Thiodiazotropha endolucinida]|nr:hypothetical protein [Candidatus Thiodiazotropha taylori]MCW4351555.1 hypothetical protein [Candidatus Thiodiazotropha endolucinida]